MREVHKDVELPDSQLETVMTLNLIELARVLFDTTLLTLLPV